jgi:hypothetical protein
MPFLACGPWAVSPSEVEDGRVSRHEPRSRASPLCWLGTYNRVLSRDGNPRNLKLYWRRSGF